ncbi:MAG: GH1 family beta-glucosidase [Acidimicrobiales bacterium]|jgi:beta-glucosidase
MTDQLVFPKGFLWGVATASYQIEGAVDENGRTPSIWDTFSHLPGTTLHGDNGDIACDHYHRLDEDVELMAELGIRAYRFSIAWPRVQPHGKTAVNQIGLDHYRRLVDALRAHDIEPVATLYHWDLPQALEDGGGWTNRDTAGRLEDYARVVAGALGDRVQRWITLNEPWVAAFIGYGNGHHAPGLSEIGAGVVAAHHLLLGHGMAARVIAETAGRSPEIGISLNLSPVRPASGSDEDAAAVERVDEQRNRWFLDAVLRGSYPERLLEEYESLIGDDFLHDGDLEVIRADLDFLGVNYYTPLRAAASTNAKVPATRHCSYASWLGVEDRPRGDVARTTKGWTIEPDGLTELLLRLGKDYGGIPLYISENGAAFSDYVDPNGEVRDPERIEYLRGHLAAAHAAIAQGVDLRAYFVWSLYDNFEWADGYGQRFGLVFTDYRTQDRIPKASAHWYRRVIAANALDV